jgi:integrase
MRVHRVLRCVGDGLIDRRVSARAGPACAGRASQGSGAALIISKWAGHYDSAFTQKTYVHASEEDLQRGKAALTRIHKIA